MKIEKLEQTLKDFNARFTIRQKALMVMEIDRLKAIARDCGLPSDLNRYEIVKYILQKEFPVQ